MPDHGLICLSTTGGTTGDVRPLIALALALRARGFAILLDGNVTFERTAARAGITPAEWFTNSQIPQTFRQRTESGQRWLWGERSRRRDRPIRREIQRHLAERTQAYWRRLEGPDNPRIVAAIGSISAIPTLLEFGSRCARIISCPMPYQPTAAFTMEPPDRSRATRLSAWVQENWTRRQELEETRRRFCEELFHLVSASPTILPRPADWLPNMQVTGYTPLEDEAGWSPSAAVQEFLRAGPPPVFIGFGSYAMFFGARGERLAREVIEGCRRRDVRCILQSPDLPRTLASDRVFLLDEDVPHAWLFPRCAAIVHHGGYGTVHTALVARRPMVIYPFQTDQFLWAARMGELGVGPGFTSRLRDLTAARLAEDLAFVLRPVCEAHAAHVGAAVAHEQGLDMQVAAIESIIAHTQRGLRPVEWRMPAGELTPC